MGESCTRNCGHNGPWPTRETADINSAATLSSTPSSSPRVARAAGVEMQPRPGRGGAQGRGRAAQVGGAGRPREKARPIKCSLPQRRCSAVRRVPGGLGPNGLWVTGGVRKSEGSRRRRLGGQGLSHCTPVRCQCAGLRELRAGERQRTGYGVSRGWGIRCPIHGGGVGGVGGELRGASPLQVLLTFTEFQVVPVVGVSARETADFSCGDRLLPCGN